MLCTVIISWVAKVLQLLANISTVLLSRVGHQKNNANFTSTRMLWQYYKHRVTSTIVNIKVMHLDILHRATNKNHCKIYDRAN